MTNVTITLDDAIAARVEARSRGQSLKFMHELIEREIGRDANLHGPTSRSE